MRVGGGWSCPATRFDDLGPYSLQHYRDNWRQLVLEAFAGITMALGLVGESIAFAFLLHVGPLVALHATWITVLIVALLGSRPGMANGADGVRAASLASFVLEFGVGALFYAVLIISAFFFLFALTRAYRLVKLIPHTAMIGFLNGLAIIIFKGQVEQLQVRNATAAASQDQDDVTIVWQSGAVLGWMFFEIILTMLIIFALARLPRVGKYIPGAIMAILTTTFFEHVILRPSITGMETPTIGSVATVSGAFPQPFWLDAQYAGQLPSFSWDFFLAILWPSFSTACACFIEIVLIMEYVDDANEEQNRFPNRHIFSFALANLVCGLLGTMGGSSLLGTTILLRMSGASGRYEIPALVTAGCLLVFIIVLGSYIEYIPTAALIGVMTMICIHTFQWDSLPMMLFALLPLRVRERTRIAAKWKIKRFDALVIAVVSILTPLVNLFVAVLVGVLLTSLFVVSNSGNRLTLVRVEEEQGIVRLHFNGELHFASTKRFAEAVMDATAKLLDDDNASTSSSGNEVQVEFHETTCAIQDFSALHELNKVGQKLEGKHKRLVLCNLDDFSRKFLSRADTLRKHFSVQGEEDEEV